MNTKLHYERQREIPNLNEYHPEEKNLTSVKCFGNVRLNFTPTHSAGLGVSLAIRIMPRYYIPKLWQANFKRLFKACQAIWNFHFCVIL
jgi:hypothetical protein